MAADSSFVVNYYQFLGLKDFESNIALIKQHCDKKILDYEHSKSIDIEKIKFVRHIYSILRDKVLRKSYNKQLASFPEKLQSLRPRIRSEQNNPKFFSEEEFVFYTYVSIRQYFGLDEKDPINAEQVNDFKLFVSSMLKVFPEETQVLPDHSIRVSAAAHSFLINMGCVGFLEVFSSAEMNSKVFPHLELHKTLQSTKELLGFLEMFREYNNLKGKREFIEAVKSSISRKPYLVISDRKGWNVLHFAVYYDLTELASLILESASKAQKEQLLKAETYKNKNTPMMMAKKNRSRTMIELLEDSASQCIVNFNLAFSDELIPLLREGCVFMGDSQENEKITQFRRLLLELKNLKELTSSSQAALITGIQELIRSDQRLSLVVTESGWNILHIAVAKNLEDLAIWIRDTIPVAEQQPLLAAKTHRSKSTPLKMAKDRENKRLIDLLTEMQTGSMSVTRTPLMSIDMPVNMPTAEPGATVAVSKLSHPTLVNPRGFYPPKRFTRKETEQQTGSSNIPGCGTS